MDLAKLLQRLRREGAITLTIHVRPSSPRTGWRGALADGSFKIDVAQIPERGKVNGELIRFLAEEFKVPVDGVAILRGLSARIKVIQVRASSTP
ncbi:MAG: DUF167 domain-containing protein [Candidatus Peribacteraceae bacterium]|nr:DUF167 domain-containing protein [Candidatus Peribacteraceae bacterium]